MNHRAASPQGRNLFRIVGGNCYFLEISRRTTARMSFD